MAEHNTMYRAFHRIGLILRETRPALALGIVAITALSGAIPSAIAAAGKRVVDGVTNAIQRNGGREDVFHWVALEIGLVAILSVCVRGEGILRALLQTRLSQHVNEIVLRKAISLQLSDFETASFYDLLSCVERGVSYRPMQVASGALALLRNAITLVGFSILLCAFSPLLLLVLCVAAFPAFLAEARFNANAFQLFRRQSTDARRQAYIHTVLTRDDHAQEIRLFGLGPTLLDRFKTIFERRYSQDVKLVFRRGSWGGVLALISAATGALGYVWIVARTMDGALSLGEMTMLLVVLKQSQSVAQQTLLVIAGMYDDHQYMMLLDHFLRYPTRTFENGVRIGINSGDGIRFERVTFSYPGSSRPALKDFTLHIPQGTKIALVGANGAGKSTIIKLLTRLYSPSAGRILLDGVELDQWDTDALNRRMGVVLQDFVRYQMLAKENIAIGDIAAVDDRARLERAADDAMAKEDIESLPRQYDTQLGHWFEGGVELSGGQWQKIALSRIFMRRDADIWVLDEPTASLDPEAESGVFDRFAKLSEGRIVIVVSHRFSTVRMANRIVVLDQGTIVEEGSHGQLVRQGGRYAAAFSRQAQAYTS